MPTKRASVGRLFVGFFVILFLAPGFPLQPRLRKSLPKMCVKKRSVVWVTFLHKGLQRKAVPSKSD